MSGYFEDRQFPPVVALRGVTIKQPFEWKRPWQLVSWAKLYKGGRLQKGVLKNSWFLAAIDLLSYNPELRKQLLSCQDDYPMSGSPYNGRFTFRFWPFGKWREVSIDDRLPVYSGNKKLVFTDTDIREDFWAALVEKAYAKLRGSYGALSQGDVAESLADLTGGLVLRYEASAIRSKDFRRALDNNGLVTVSIEGKAERLANGLIRGLTYSVTSMTTVSTESGEVELLRLRSPWGNEKEWNSKWSDGSADWDSVSESDRSRLDVDLAAEDDGMFWISLDDVKANFNDVVIAYVDASNALGRQDQWEQIMVEGKWKGETAGGCNKFPESFAKNPQFRLRLTSDDGVFICLSQKTGPGSRIRPIGFAVYESPEDCETLDETFLAQKKQVAGFEGFPKQRDVTDFCDIKAGSYVIIPFTVKHGNEGEFVMRAFAEPGKATFS